MAAMTARGRTEVVMRKIETALLDGTWPAGARLPAERVLAQQYGWRAIPCARRPSGSSRGLLQSRRGAGVFATDQLRAGIASPWGQLVADHPALRDDILEFRRVLEGATAYFAALRADANDRRRIRGLLRELETAHANDDAVVEASADAKLHEAIALASHNTMFLHLHTSVLGMLREHISINVAGMTTDDEQASELLLQQHRVVCDAICAHRPEEARTAMQTHIDYVRSHSSATAPRREIGWTTAPVARA
jgi:GntR family transcriptional repressor for pyruvate dehydrogenase complex